MPGHEAEWISGQEYFVRPYGVLNLDGFTRASGSAGAPRPEHYLGNYALHGSILSKSDWCHQCASKVHALVIHQWLVHSSFAWFGQTAANALDSLVVRREYEDKRSPPTLMLWSSFAISNNRLHRAFAGRMEFQRQTRCLGLTAHKD